MNFIYLNRWLVLCLLVLASTCFSLSPGRIVLVEEYTATWCSYCPKAAEALEELSERFPGRVLIVAYHSDRLNDPFGFAEGVARGEMRNVDAFPAVFVDGKQVSLGDGTAELTVLLYPSIETRATLPPVLNISIGYNAHQVQVSLRNSSKGAKEVNVFIAAVTPKTNHGKKEYGHVCRALLHNDRVKVPEKVGGKIEIVQEFPLKQEWWGEGLDIIAWVEDAANGEVLAASSISINQQ